MPDDRMPAEGNEEKPEFEQMAEEYLEAIQTPRGEDPPDSDETLEGDGGGAADADDDGRLAQDESGQEGADEEGDQQGEGAFFTLPDTDLYGALRGQKVSINQLVESGLLNKLLTRDHQEMHHTHLYQELKRRYDETAQRLERLEKPPEPQPEQRPISPAQSAAAVHAHYFPVLAEAAKAGAFESHFLEDYPNVATQLEHRFQTGAVAIQQLAQRMEQITELVTGVKGRVESDDSVNHVNREMEALAATDERLFGRLNDADHRNEYLRWLVDEKNPLPFKDMDTSQVTAEILAAGYLAYLRSNRSLASANAPVSTPKPPVKRKPNLSSDGTGSTTRSKGGPARDGLEGELDELKAGLAKVHNQRLQGV